MDGELSTNNGISRFFVEGWVGSWPKHPTSQNSMPRRTAWIMPRALYSYLTTPWTWPLGEMWLILIKTGSTSEKREICQCSPPSIFSPLHTLILRTDPPIFPPPDLSLIFIILSNAPDPASQTLPAPLPVQYHPHQTHTQTHSTNSEQSFCKTDSLGVTTCKIVTWVPSWGFKA